MESSSTRARTWNLAVNSRSLCRLSYRGRRAGLYVQGMRVSSDGCRCEPPLVERKQSRPLAAKQSHVTCKQLFCGARGLLRRGAASTAVFALAQTSAQRVRHSSQRHLVLNPAQLAQFVLAMRGGDLADGAGQSAHDERVGGDAVAEVTHTLEELPVGDARGGKEHIL